MTAILTDINAEGRRLLDLAGEHGVPLRLLGGVAIQLRAPAPLPPELSRTCGDLDFVCAKGGAKDAERLLSGAGYEPQVSFNALNGRERLLFRDEPHDRQIDVFVGAFRMCHEIPLKGRLDDDGTGTIPLAELLLTKLQIIEVNEKDVRDTLALLHGHDVADADGDTVNAARVAELCASDWGLWRTITANLAACRARVGDYALPDADRARLEQRLDALLARIEAEPKSRGWRLRAKVGERKRWYELPEEVAQGAPLGGGAGA